MVEKSIICIHMRAIHLRERLRILLRRRLDFKIGFKIPAYRQLRSCENNYAVKIIMASVTNWNMEDLRDNTNSFSRTNIPLLWNIFDSIRRDGKFFSHFSEYSFIWYSLILIDFFPFNLILIITFYYLNIFN